MKRNRLVLAISVVAVIGLGLIFFSRQSPSSKDLSSDSTASSTLGKLNFKKSDWQLRLVNKEYPLPKDYSFQQTTIDGEIVDSRIADAVNQFRLAAQNAGFSTTIISGYRSIADQTNVYDQSVDSYRAEGMTQAQAEAETQKTIQTPGSSEHATGLAIDLADNQALADHPELSETMESYQGQQWLMENAAKYGFIVRYPSGEAAKKSTGIDYEPWHFRYVGKDAAEYIVKNNLTLEQLIKELDK